MLVETLVILQAKFHVVSSLLSAPCTPIENEFKLKTKTILKVPLSS